MTSHAIRRKDPQRRPAIACASLIGAALVLVLVGRHPPQPPEIDPASVVESMDLRFSDLADGSVVALNAATGAKLERIDPGVGGFIRVTMRSFANERKQRGLSSDVPFTLTRMKDGDLLLRDPLTGRTMLLNAFGPSNEGAFAQLLDKGRTTQ